MDITRYRPILLIMGILLFVAGSLFLWTYWHSDADLDHHTWYALYALPAFIAMLLGTVLLVLPSNLTLRSILQVIAVFAIILVILWVIPYLLFALSIPFKYAALYHACSPGSYRLQSPIIIVSNLVSPFSRCFLAFPLCRICQRRT